MWLGKRCSLTKLQALPAITAMVVSSLSGARDEVLLTATAQNLRRLRAKT
jgi:hypothetical protein